MEKVVALGGLCNQRKNTFTKIPSINSDYAEIDRATATMYFFWDKMNTAMYLNCFCGMGECIYLPVLSALLH